MAFCKLHHRQNSKGERVYYVEYRLPGRKNTKFTIGNVEARKAKEIADNIRALILQGIDPHEYAREQAKYSKEKPRLKLSELIEKYIQSCRITNQTRTIEIKESACKVFREFIGDPNIDQITIEKVEEWLTSLKLSKTSANMYLRAIKAMFNWGHKRNLVNTNPFDNINQYKVPDSDPEDYFTIEEISLILSELKKTNKPLWRLITIALETGGRISELLELTGEDIELENERILFRGSTTKTGQRRYVPIRAETAVLIKKWEKNPSGKIFTSWASRNGPTLAFRRLLKRLGLWETRNGTRSFHTLRHTYASHLLMSGINIYIVSKWMGHSSVKVTEKHYGHLIPDIVSVSLPWTINDAN